LKKIERTDCIYHERRIVESGDKMNTIENTIPKTGRIGRFAKIIEKEVSKNMMLKILQDSDKYTSYSPSKKAEWWKDAIIRMETELGTKKTKEILSICGSKCCGQGHRKTVRKKFEDSNSIEEFLNKISIKGVTYKLVDKNTIMAEYHRCFCGQVKGTTVRFPTMTYCQCGTEFNRQYFSSAFSKPVEVELIKSVISGSDSCKFHIYILSDEGNEL
jgi:hypothetical protein